MLVIELVLPWFIFGPRWLRLIACVGFTLLMMLIAATGNYTFFNLLTMLLAMLLIDDQAWPKLVRKRFSRLEDANLAARLRGRLTLMISAVLIALTLQPTQFRFSQFHLFNGYGLFQRMTETRPEIIVEGSDDGQTWKEYAFHWKPGELTRYPARCAPHQPRLDWQMWFEALQLERVYLQTGGISEQHLSRWFRTLISRLLEGEPRVLALMDENPFPESPPHLIRVSLYQYRFSTIEERRVSGQWWMREVVYVSPRNYSLP